MMNDISTLYDNMDMLYTAQCNFSPTVCDELFLGDSHHMWDKWIYEARCNMIMYYSILDVKNKYILISWIFNLKI